MKQRPRPDDRFTPRTFHRWNTVCWVLLGLLPTAVAVLNDPGAKKYWTWGLLALLALCHAIMRAFPRSPVLRTHILLGVLVLGLGGISYLLGGAAALFVVTLPHFWIFARSPRSSIITSGVAAVVTVFGGLLRQGWSPEFFNGNAVFTVLGYVAGVVVGLWVRRIVEHGDERTRRLGAELDSARLRLAEAHQRQGAADERERLAREIHDTLAQGFASIIALAEAARTTMDTDPVRSAQQLFSIERTARENFTEARVLVGSDPQTGVAPGPVSRALDRTLQRFAQDTGLTVSADLPDVQCDQRTRIALLRCTQESLANVRKHAAASTVGVVLAVTQDHGGVELEITDDGRGFVVSDSRGFGLDGMRKRLAELGGELSVTSSPGDGTRVLATIPTNGQV